MGSEFNPPVIRKLVTIVEEIQSVAGIVAERPLRRAAVAAVLSNPYAGQYVADLKPLIDWSAGLGDELGKLAGQALGLPAESYGKGGIAGMMGEQEHANALLTTTMAEGLRDAVGGGKAWISSTTKVGPPGTPIDIPLAHKDALYVRSHYDAMEVCIPDAPLPDELVAIVVVATGARLNARVGGLRADEIKGEDGLLVAHQLVSLRSWWEVAMKRLARRVILTLVLGTVALPPLAEAQQPAKVPRVGFLAWGSPPPADRYGEPFRQGLRDLGYVEGKTIVVEYRWAGGQSDRAAEFAAELVRIKVDVIVAFTTPAVQAAKNATTTIPIVVSAADPVGTGFVASLARPGGNITGVSLMLPDLAGKRLELLREVLPGVVRVAFLAGGGPDTAAPLFIRETQVAGQKLGVQIQPVVGKGPEEFEGAFSAMRRERAGALIVQPIFTEHRQQIVALAARHRLPIISDSREFADAGGLMSYGPNLREIYRRAATYVDKILKGAKPADLPVEQPTRFELVVNMKTAKTLGLTIPPSVLIRADHVIQ